MITILRFKVYNLITTLNVRIRVVYKVKNLKFSYNSHLQWTLNVRLKLEKINYIEMITITIIDWLPYGIWKNTFVGRSWQEPNLPDVIIIMF